MKTADMIGEYLERATETLERLNTQGEVIEALDRDGDFDLHDQMRTWEDLTGSMAELLERMKKISGYYEGGTH